MFEFVNDYKTISFPTFTKVCPDCNKKCKTKRGCLIGQIQNNLENKTSFMAISMKLQGIPDGDIAWIISVSKDYKNRGKPFGKAFWGSLKIK